jgi:hypothetical protein
MSRRKRDYRVWKWNHLGNRRQKFFFVCQVYMAIGWLAFHATFKRVLKGHPIVDLAIVLSIIHFLLIVMWLFFYSLKSEMDNVAWKRLCEWTQFSSAFLTLAYILSFNSVSFNISAITMFLSTLTINIEIFSHFGTPDLINLTAKLGMIAIWFAFLARTVSFLKNHSTLLICCNIFSSFSFS